MANHSAKTPDNGGYEKTDANIRMIVVSAIILTITVIASFGIVRLTYVMTEKKIVASRPAAPPMLQTDILPPAPRLRVNGQMRLAELRAYEHDLLNTHEWIDEANGIARIPIERAKALLAQPAPAADAAPAATAAEHPADAGADHSNALVAEPAPAVDAAPATPAAEHPADHGHADAGTEHSEALLAEPEPEPVPEPAADEAPATTAAEQDQTDAGGEPVKDTHATPGN